MYPSTSGSTLKTAFASVHELSVHVHGRFLGTVHVGVQFVPENSCCTVVHGLAAFSKPTMRVYTSRHVFLGRSPHPRKTSADTLSSCLSRYTHELGVSVSHRCFQFSGYSHTTDLHGYVRL